MIARRRFPREASASAAFGAIGEAMKSCQSCRHSLGTGWGGLQCLPRQFVIVDRIVRSGIEGIRIERKLADTAAECYLYEREPGSD